MALNIVFIPASSILVMNTLFYNVLYKEVKKMGLFFKNNTQPAF